MPIITNLQFQARTKRTSVYLDNQYSFSLNTEVVLLNQLKINQELTQEKIEDILFQSLFKELHNLVMSKISLRPQSIQETKIYLQKKIYNLNQNLQKININPKICISKANTTTLINQIIEELTKKDYLNDQTFSKWWIEKRLNSSPKGKQALFIELHKKGIDSNTINSVLHDENLINKSTQDVMISSILEKAYKTISYKNYDKYKLKQILVRRLLSKGFIYSEFKNQIDEFIQKKYNA